MNEDETLSLSEALKAIIEDPGQVTPWRREGQPGPAERLLRKVKPQAVPDKVVKFDPARDGLGIIERCPRASQPALRELFSSIVNGSDLYAMALGSDGRKRSEMFAEPGDIFATRLSGEGIAEWRWTTFDTSNGDRLRLFDLSKTSDLVENGIVKYDVEIACIIIDEQRLPNDGKWRLLWLTSDSSPVSATFSDFVIFCIRREPLNDTARHDPAAAILSGHFFHAWNLVARQREGWQDEELLWLLASLFFKMQDTIEHEILVPYDSAPVLDSAIAGMLRPEFEPLIEHLERSLIERVRSVRHGIWAQLARETN